MFLNAYPEGARAADDKQWLPLHLAAAKEKSLEVLAMLVHANPEGAAAQGSSGKLPVHCLGSAVEPSPKNKEEVAAKVETLVRPILDNDEACRISSPSGLYNSIEKTPLQIAADFDVLSLHTCVKMTHCPAEIVIAVAKRHPEQLRIRDNDGNLILHHAAVNVNFNGAQVLSGGPENSDGEEIREDLICVLVKMYPRAAVALNGEGRSPLVLAIESDKRWHEGVEAIVDAAESVENLDEYIALIKDDATNMYPFMLAARGDNPCLSTVFSLLVRCPELGRYA